MRGLCTTAPCSHISLGIIDIEAYAAQTPHNILLLIIILGAVHPQPPHIISFFLLRCKKRILARVRSVFATAKHEDTFNGKNQAERNNGKKEKAADQIVSVKLNIQPVNSLRSDSTGSPLFR